MMLDDAQSIIIIPGYGLAVAQAQYILHTLENALIEKGARVRYAIHPLAGRMPKHMNILLAEAKVPQELLFAPDTINDDFRIPILHWLLALTILLIAPHIRLIIPPCTVCQPSMQTKPGQ